MSLQHSSLFKMRDKDHNDRQVYEISLNDELVYETVMSLCLVEAVVGQSL